MPSLFQRYLQHSIRSRLSKLQIKLKGLQAEHFNIIQINPTDTYLLSLITDNVRGIAETKEAISQLKEKLT